MPFGATDYTRLKNYLVGSSVLPSDINEIQDEYGNAVQEILNWRGSTNRDHLYGTYAARPAASASLNGARYFCTDKLMEYQCILGAWVLVGAYARRVTALSFDPLVNADRELVALTTNSPYVHPQAMFDDEMGEPVEWWMRWDGVRESWNYVGGPSVNDEQSGSWTPNITAIGGDEPNAKLESHIHIKVPYTGVYDVAAFAKFWKTTSGVQSISFGTYTTRPGDSTSNLYWATSTHIQAVSQLAGLNIRADMWMQGGDGIRIGFYQGSGSVPVALDVYERSLKVRPKWMYAASGP